MNYENHICELRINMSEIVILAVCFQQFHLLFQLLKLKAHCEDHNFTQFFFVVVYFRA